MANIMEIEEKEFETAIRSSLHTFKDLNKSTKIMRRKMEDTKRTKWKFWR